MMKNMGFHYILDENKNPVPCDLITWAETFENPNNRLVRAETINGLRISTMFLGMDHSFDEDEVHLFETMVFDEKGESVEMDRCDTWDNAIKMHETMVERVKSGDIGK